MIGLNVSFILKKMNSVVKVFAAAAHAPIEVFVAHFVLKTRLTGTILIAAFLIIAAICLFKLSPLLEQTWPWILCNSCCSSKEPRSNKIQIPPNRCFCCFKKSKQQMLLALERRLDAIYEKEMSDNPKEIYDNIKETEKNHLVSPLVRTLEKIKEYESLHGIPQSYYWSMDDQGPSSKPECSRL